MKHFKIGFVRCLKNTSISVCNNTKIYFYNFQGRLMDKTDAYFSSFRRCNYPRLMSDGTVALVHECGRYARSVIMCILILS